MKMDASSILTLSTNDVKVFLGLLCPKIDSINIEWCTGGYLNPCSTLGICFWEHNCAKQGSRSLFSCGSNSGNGSVGQLVGWLVGKNDFKKSHHKT